MVPVLIAPPGSWASKVIPPDLIPFNVIEPLFSNLESEPIGTAVLETTIPWLLALFISISAPTSLIAVICQLAVLLSPEKSLVANPAEFSPPITIFFLFTIVW